MSEFKIKCETFLRLAGICEFFEPSVEDGIRDKINTVRIENHNGISLGIATNQKVAAVEYLGDTDQPDGVIHIKLTSELIEQCKLEVQFDSVLTIVTVPEMGISSIQTTFGFNVTDGCYWFVDTELNNWREWGAANATASKGVMYWNLYQLEPLIKSAPSGKIIFPEFIDTNQPVTLRDHISPNWVGIFFPKPSDAVITEQAALPDWWSA